MSRSGRSHRALLTALLAVDLDRARDESHAVPEQHGGRPEAHVVRVMTYSLANPWFHGLAH
jgi:hypothetical protein